MAVAFLDLKVPNVDVASEGALCSVLLHLDATDIKLIYYHFLTTRSYNSDGP